MTASHKMSVYGFPDYPEQAEPLLAIRALGISISECCPENIPQGSGYIKPGDQAGKQDRP
ncbi:MAG TPA: hypothetical protein ENI64_11125 [Gammaproteobacteria bacterium]|nr:hypothetical protein [Gammaproteobacteria bacterium]